MSETKAQYTLSKAERLSYQKRIDHLFTQGESFIAYPLRVVYCIRDVEDGDPAISILTSVSKRKFKRAVKRNRVKRLIREAYRLNKTKLTATVLQAEKCIDVAFLYLKNELPDYIEIEKSILKTAVLLEEKLLQRNANESNP